MDESKLHLKNYSAAKTTLKDIPLKPGVYFFKNDQKQVIYVGKAKSLKNRLTSYFATTLEPKTQKMIEIAQYLSFIEVASEFEALLLEAHLIRKFLPKYNIQLRDDKSPLYIVITKEEFPRVVTARKTDLTSFKAKKIYGPFLSGLVVRRMLGHLRRVFPYSNHKLGKRGCIYSQIGLCNPCPNNIVNDPTNFELDKKQYLKNINDLIRVLDGKSAKVKNDLETQMKLASNKQDFEEASSIKNKLRQLNYLTTQSTQEEGYVENPNLLEDVRKKELQSLQEILNPYFNFTHLNRIECFDVAHLSGTFPTASLVTFVNGEADKRFYRHFKINPKLKGDTDRMREVLTRRLNRFEDWGKPDLIIVDGGKPQVSIAADIILDKVPVIGLAKRFETLVIKQGNVFHEVRLKKGPALYLVQRLRDEAHRFSRRLHHKQIARLFDNKS